MCAYLISTKVYTLTSYAQESLKNKEARYIKLPHFRSLGQKINLSLKKLCHKPLFMGSP